MPDRQDFPTEEELTRALAGSEEVPGTTCPDAATLKRFAMGKYGIDNPAVTAILEHLADCERCEQKLGQIRKEAEKSSRRIHSHGWYRWRLAYALFSVVVLVGTWFWVTRERIPEIATIDLRNITRGVEPSSDAATITVSRKARALRVLLPVGSVSGKYDVAVFNKATPESPILVASGRASYEQGEIVLAIHLPLNDIKPGSYLLGIRYQDSEWVYYALAIH